MFERRRLARQDAEAAGRILSRLHWQCWRNEPPPCDVEPDEFVSVMPVVMRSGSVGLVWPRMRTRFAPGSAIALAMESALAAQREHNARVASGIASTVSLLRANGIDPVLVKGLAISRQYPDSLVRLAGDIDLIVTAPGRERAKVLLDSISGQVRVGVDLQVEDEWFDRPEDGFRDRLRTVEIGGEPVRVLGPEDQLRVHALHLIRHGGRRPLWLADIGLALDALEPGFDPGVVFGADPVRASWVGTVIRLATDLAGAEVPVSMRLPDGDLPSWLPREVQRQWHETDPFPNAVFDELRRNPAGIVSTFRRRWPPPIRATWLLRRRFTSAPRLPIQIAAYAKLIGSYAVYRLPKQASGRRT